MSLDSVFLYRESLQSVQNNASYLKNTGFREKKKKAKKVMATILLKKRSTDFIFG